MLYTIVPSDMKELEARYMAQYHVPGALLMEHAAQGVAEALARYAPKGGTVLFVCGSGNNGGDGYAAARLWMTRGGHSLVWELDSAARGDALMNRQLLLELGCEIVTLRDAPDRLPICDAVCDAMFGTGLARAVSGLAADVIALINRSGKPVVAVDIPSGLDGESGLALGQALRACETVTFHRIKQGLLLRDGACYAGKITVHPILIPASYLLQEEQERLAVLTPQELPRVLPRRPADAHKGTFGRVVLFAGSVGMAGAAALCARAAIRAGAGLTTILCRASILPVLQVLAPGAMCVPLPECEGSLTPEAAEIARRTLEHADAAAFGCGVGQREDLLPVMDAFDHSPCPVVWDADGLNLKARCDQPFRPQDYCTPHPAEAARLLHTDTQHVLAQPLACLAALGERCGHVLLKGARTLMRSDHRLAVNMVGTPALAKGGSGDVLTGILTALVARRLGDGLITMQTAALVHGMAGIRAERMAGENCVTPEMLVDCVRLDDSGL